jgi:uncharacterized protein
VKRLFLAVAGAAIAVAATLAALGGYVSGRIDREALLASYDHAADSYDDAVVTAVDSTSLTLTATNDERGRVAREGMWEVRWKGGSGRVGRVLGRDPAGTRWRRAFEAFGERPVPGDRVNLRLEVYPGDPMTAFGIPFQTVSIATELGAAPAWFVPASRATWVVFVHGKGAPLRQSLRTLPLFHSLGFPILAIRYRNDEGAPPSPDGRYHYGLTEWRDLEAAVRFALGHGAADVVLVGESMGGGIVAAFLERSPFASRADAAILDAPMLDFGETIDWGVAQATLPGTRIPMPALAGRVGKSFAAQRYGIDWAALDLRRSVPTIRAPLLILHGDADAVVPYATSQALARSFPGRVTLVSFHGANHAEAWNVDSLAFNRAIRGFLERRIADRR